MPKKKRLRAQATRVMKFVDDPDGRIEIHVRHGDKTVHFVFVHSIEDPSNYVSYVLIRGSYGVHSYDDVRYRSKWLPKPRKEYHDSVSESSIFHGVTSILERLDIPAGPKTLKCIREFSKASFARSERDCKRAAMRFKVRKIVDMGFSLEDVVSTFKEISLLQDPRI